MDNLDVTQSRLDDLTNAAKLKLQKQKEMENAPGGDIYAQLREEASAEEYGTYPKLQNNPDQPFEDDTDYEVDNPVDEDDVQVYENGPFKSQVDIWKKQYGEGHVFHIAVLERHFVIRTLNRYEYKQLVGLENTDALMREEIICSRCVLHPRNYSFKVMASDDAGYPGIVSQIIMEMSGFSKDYGIEVL